MPPQGNVNHRLDALERQLLQVQHVQNQQPCRDGIPGAPRQVRLAKTITTGGSYPTAPADTYGIIFLDGTFTTTQGNNGETMTDRQSSALVTAHSIDGRYYPTGSYVWVARLNHKWWIIDGPGGQEKARFIEFTLPSALALTDASKASCPVVAFWGGYDPGSTVTVYNYADVAGNYQWEGDNGAHGYAVWDDVLGRYRIWDLNCPS